MSSAHGEIAGGGEYAIFPNPQFMDRRAAVFEPLEAEPQDLFPRYHELEMTLGRGAQKALARAVLCDNQSERPPLIEDPEQLRVRAETMDAAIETQLDLLRRRYRSEGDTELRREIDKGQDKLPFGDPAWAHDIMLAMLRDEPTKVWLDLKMPEISHRRIYDTSSVSTERTGYFIHQAPPPGATYTDKTEAMWPDYDSMVKMELAAALYAIKPPNAAMRIILNLNKSTLRHEHPELLVLLVAEGFRRYGLPDIDELGNEVVVTSEYAQQDLVPEAISRLASSGNGYVDIKPESTWFIPAPWLTGWNDLRHDGRRTAPKSNSMALKSSAMPYWVTNRLTTFLGPEEAGYNHVLIGDTTASWSNDRLKTLLRALGIAHQDTCQVITSGSHMGNYKVLKVLQNEIHKYLESLETYTPFDQLDVESYVKKNYTPEVMLQDREIIEESIRATPIVAAELGVDPDRPETLLKNGEAMHICAGGNLYPIMLRSWITQPGQKITAWDIAPAAKEYMDRVKYEGYDTKRWESFQDRIVVTARESSGLYVACMADALDKLDFATEDIANMPEGTVGYMGMHFGAEAAKSSPGPVHKILRDCHRALRKRNSVLEAVFTLDSDVKWPDGTGNVFRAVSLPEKRIKLALVDSDFEILVSKVIGKRVPPKLRVRPNELFLYIVARPRQES